MNRAGLRIWRTSSVMLTAMAMTATDAHLMELPAKMRYEAPLYVRLHRTLYSTFGGIAGPAEALALVSTLGLAWWTRQRRPEAFPSVAVAAGALVCAHALYWSVVQPVNDEMARWSLDAIPVDWASWR